MERHRRFLIGKKATRDIAAGRSAVIVKAGEEITKEVLQKSQFAKKLIELSMNAQQDWRDYMSYKRHLRRLVKRDI